MGCTACYSQALNSIDPLSEWQTQQMLTLSNAQCLSSPPRFCPVMALRRGERSGHLTLSDGGSARVCVSACWWASMAVYEHVTNRPASSVPYQAGPILTSTPSTSSAIHHSAVACHSESLIHVLAESSWLSTVKWHYYSSLYIHGGKTKRAVRNRNILNTGFGKLFEE